MSVQSGDAIRLEMLFGTTNELQVVSDKCSGERKVYNFIKFIMRNESIDLITRRMQHHSIMIAVLSDAWTTVP